MARTNPEEFVRRVTRRIQQVRKASGITQEQLADKLGIAVRNVQRMEAGQNLTLASLARVANAIGVRPEELVVPGDQPARPSLHRRAVRGRRVT